MRRPVLIAVAALALSSLPALADENFIPMGQDYSLGQNPAPPLDSKQSQFNAQVDIYQSEIYNRNLQRKQFNSRIFNLANEQSPSDIDDNDLDY